MNGSRSKALSHSQRHADDSVGDTPITGDEPSERGHNVSIGEAQPAVCTIRRLRCLRRPASFPAMTSRLASGVRSRDRVVSTLCPRLAARTSPGRGRAIDTALMRAGPSSKRTALRGRLRQRKRKHQRRAVPGGRADGRRSARGDLLRGFGLMTWSGVVIAPGSPHR
jgi:hypothetical protein